MLMEAALAQDRGPRVEFGLALADLSAGRVEQRKHVDHADNGQDIDCMERIQRNRRTGLQGHPEAGRQPPEQLAVPQVGVE